MGLSWAEIGLSYVSLKFNVSYLIFNFPLMAASCLNFTNLRFGKMCRVRVSSLNVARTSVTVNYVDIIQLLNAEKRHNTSTSATMECRSLEATPGHQIPGWLQGVRVEELTGQAGDVMTSRGPLIWTEITFLTEKQKKRPWGPGPEPVGGPRKIERSHRNRLEQRNGQRGWLAVSSLQSLCIKEKRNRRCDIVRLETREMRQGSNCVAWFFRPKFSRYFGNYQEFCRSSSTLT